MSRRNERFNRKMLHAEGFGLRNRLCHMSDGGRSVRNMIRAMDSYAEEACWSQATDVAMLLIMAYRLESIRQGRLVPVMLMMARHRNDLEKSFADLGELWQSNHEAARRRYFDNRKKLAKLLGVEL